MIPSWFPFSLRGNSHHQETVPEKQTDLTNRIVPLRCANLYKKSGDVDEKNSGRQAPNKSATCVYFGKYNVV